MHTAGFVFVLVGGVAYGLVAQRSSFSVVVFIVLWETWVFLFGKTFCLLLESIDIMGKMGNSFCILTLKNYYIIILLVIIMFYLKKFYKTFYPNYPNLK